MEHTMYFKNIKVTPKKLRLMMPRIKSMKPVDSLNNLLYSPTKSSKIFYKLIKSAITAASQTLNTEESMLKFKVLAIDEGTKMKRYIAGSRGSAKPFRKKFSHVRIVLSADKVKSAVQTTKSIESEVSKKTQKVEIEAKPVVKNAKPKAKVKKTT